MKSLPFNPKFRQNTVFILMLFLVSACFDMNTKSNENDRNALSEKSTSKQVREVILVDNGAVVPVPTIRRFVMTFKNSDNILFAYTEQTGTYVSENQSNMLINAENREAMRDEIDKIAELAEDGLDVNPGKQPCVGMNSFNIEVVFSTGDTSRFDVSGAARCDPSLYPSVWALDSMATVVYRTYKSRL